MRLIRTPVAESVSADAICGDVVGPCPKCKGALVLMVHAPMVAGCCCDKCGHDARLPWEGGRSPSRSVLREECDGMLGPTDDGPPIDAYWVDAFRQGAKIMGLSTKQVDALMRRKTSWG